MALADLTRTLIDLVGIPSTSGHEEHVRAYLQARLTRLNLTSRVDAAGNLIAVLPGEGKPLLLNAHMDRVPPGRGHQPVLRDGILYSDGTTNLGADDAAGIALVIETLTQIIEQSLPHPPLVTVFTTGEEQGLTGASAFDPAPWHVSDGIVFDNAFEAGVVVSRGAMYVAFDIEIHGRTGHPGKGLAKTVNVIEIFRDAPYPHGSFANDSTRILISQIEAGSARNAVPDLARISGELRSHEAAEIRERYLSVIKNAFEQAAQEYGGSITFTTHPHCTSYVLDENEPLLAIYRSVLERRGATLEMRPTFIGSDTGAFRPRVRTFTLSTGVVNEHSTEEYVPLAPLEQVAEDTLQVIQAWRASADQ